jgi:hypothetical protein
MKEIKLLIYVAEILNTLPDRRNPHDHEEVLHGKNFKRNTRTNMA